MFTLTHNLTRRHLRTVYAPTLVGLIATIGLAAQGVASADETPPITLPPGLILLPTPTTSPTISVPTDITIAPPTTQPTITVPTDITIAPPTTQPTITVPTDITIAPPTTAPSGDLTPPPPPPPPATVPTAPQSLQATPGNAEVQLNWAAPVSNGGAPIINYAVQRATNSAGPWNGINFVTDTSDVAVYLTNGTKYYFRVRAQNAAGWGPWSTVVSATPRTVPTAPIELTAVPGSGVFHLSWTPPSNDGGSPIDKYRVDVSHSPSGPWWTTSHPTETSFTTSGLVIGSTYYFRIAAHNAAGWGPTSLLVSGTAQLLPPAAPQGLTATPGNASVTLTWSQLVADQYRVEMYWVDGNGGHYSYHNTSFPPLTLSGLTNGVTYKFRVLAHNGAGWGTWSTRVSAVPGTAPSAPLICAASQLVEGDTLVHVLWSPPLYNGGLPIEHYRIRQYKDGALVASTVVSGSTLASNVDVGAYGTYEIRVSAYNDKGWGPACVDTVTLDSLFNG